MPLSIVLMGMTFNLVNGFLIGYYLGNFKIYTEDWLRSPQFMIGVMVFFLGMAINWQSDTILINLRKPGETGYKIPQGKLFKYVSCPNLLGETIEWLGFAIAMWSLPFLSGPLPISFQGLWRIINGIWKSFPIIPKPGKLFFRMYGKFLD